MTFVSIGLVSRFELPTLGDFIEETNEVVPRAQRRDSKYIQNNREPML